jgi:uncharacterized protein YutE (UPF0331/DUF86 family)
MPLISDNFITLLSEENRLHLMVDSAMDNMMMIIQMTAKMDIQLGMRNGHKLVKEIIRPGH